MKVALECTDCGQRNYVTEFNKLNQQKLEDQNKFCNNEDCRTAKPHKMVKDLD